MNAGGYSAQLVQAAAVLRLGARGLALFLLDRAAANPGLQFSPPGGFYGGGDDNGGLRSVLHARLTETGHSERELSAVLVENLNDDGFLELDDETEKMMVSRFGKERLQVALAGLRAVSPPGVGARNLQECLLAQLDPLPDSAAKEAAQRIVGSRLQWFVRRRFDKLPKKNLAAATALLESLSSRPGAALDDSAPVAPPLPDAELRREKGLWKARAGAGDCSPYAAKAPGGDFTAARKIVSAVSARRRQILRLTQLIADRQSAFLAGGELKPFAMTEAARELQVSSAMISHIVADKHVLCPGGVYALKSMFARSSPSGIAVAEACAQIHSIINDEDPVHPVSDSHLQQQLRRRGIVLARRTVGKYRTAAGFLRASMRKRPQSPNAGAPNGRQSRIRQTPVSTLSVSTVENSHAN